MSFVGGGADCLANGNAIAQLNKHSQQDRSLQRQTAQGPMMQQPGFKLDNHMSQQNRANMEQFMGLNLPGLAFQFQPMRHELNMMQQKNLNWGQEFAHLPLPVQALPMAAPQQALSLAWAQDFAHAQPMAQQPMAAPSAQQPQMYRPMMGMGMGMGMMGGGMGMQHMQQAPQQPQTAQAEPQVDWDKNFAEMELLEKAAEAQTAEPEAKAKEDQKDEIIIDDKYQATFEEVWDGLNLEAIENDYISQQYEEFKKTQHEGFPADMNQWERDFARFALTRANFGEYSFEDQNQFRDLPAELDPYEIGLQLMENGAKLLEAALAFEAAIQRDQNHVGAWLKLGEVQTQNEKEIAGILALEKCLELSPENLEALMTLAISYINEGYDNAAFATLERWISTKYPQVAEAARAANPQILDEDRFSLNKRVTELFLLAAQLLPQGANMDPDVQMGLGVLFYLNEDFDKTIDCFKAALQIKPDDPVLWNRLGASLANLNRLEEAVDAYFKALELKPTFVRARYNLGVLCINIRCYKEAAEHLLLGLAMHQVEGAEVGGSGGLLLNQNQLTALTETLKRAFIAMDRRDLLEKVKPGMDLNQFRGEFDF